MKHAMEVIEAKKTEITKLVTLKCFRRFLRKHARTVVDCRWVLRWKVENGKRVLRARLTLRGFKDRESDLHTFACTASRWGQRAVNAVTAQQDDWVLLSMDIATAFARGMSFEELAALTGEPHTGCSVGD